MRKNKLLLVIFIVFVVIDVLIFSVIYIKYISPNGLSIFSTKHVTSNDFVMVFDNISLRDPFKLRDKTAISRFSIALQTNKIPIKDISFDLTYNTTQVNFRDTFIVPENIFINQKVVNQMLPTQASTPNLKTIHFDLSNPQPNDIGIGYGDFAVVGYQNLKTPDNVYFYLKNIKLITTSNQSISLPDKMANFTF